jgi:hypothetical protein
MNSNPTWKPTLCSLRARVAAGTAGLALLASIAGASILPGNEASAQSPTATATATPTATSATPSAPTTGSGLAGDSTSWEIPLTLLGVVVLGGAAAIAVAGRRQ